MTSIVTRSTNVPSDAERYDDWREKVKAREIKRQRLPYPEVEMKGRPNHDRPQRDQF